MVAVKAVKSPRQPTPAAATVVARATARVARPNPVAEDVGQQPVVADALFVALDELGDEGRSGPGASEPAAQVTVIGGSAAAPAPLSPPSSARGGSRRGNVSGPAWWRSMRAGFSEAVGWMGAGGDTAAAAAEQRRRHLGRAATQEAAAHGGRDAPPERLPQPDYEHDDVASVRSGVVSERSMRSARSVSASSILSSLTGRRRAQRLRLAEARGEELLPGDLLEEEWAAPGVLESCLPRGRLMPPPPAAMDTDALLSTSYKARLAVFEFNSAARVDPASGAVQAMQAPGAESQMSSATECSMAVEMRVNPKTGVVLWAPVRDVECTVPFRRMVEVTPEPHAGRLTIRTQPRPLHNRRNRVLFKERQRAAERGRVPASDAEAMSMSDVASEEDGSLSSARSTASMLPDMPDSFRAWLRKDDKRAPEGAEPEAVTDAYRRYAHTHLVASKREIGDIDNDPEALEEDIPERFVLTAAPTTITLMAEAIKAAFLQMPDVSVLQGEPRRLRERFERMAMREGQAFMDVPAHDATGDAMLTIEPSEKVAEGGSGERKSVYLGNREGVTTAATVGWGLRVAGLAAYGFAQRTWEELTAREEEEANRKEIEMMGDNVAYDVAYGEEEEDAEELRRDA